MSDAKHFEHEQVEAARLILGQPYPLMDKRYALARAVVDLFEQLDTAGVLLADAYSLIRYLRPDLDATRPRADSLLRRMEQFNAPEPDCYEGNVGANIAGERYPAKIPNDG